MTKEEAIKHAEWMKEFGLDNKTDEFLDMAIKALEKEPCDDAISRQAVLSKKIYTETEEGWSGYTVDADYIELLPSVEPQDPVLDKIRSEIEKIPTDYCGGYIGLDKREVLQIIDKYREVTE